MTTDHSREPGQSQPGQSQPGQSQPILEWAQHVETAIREVLATADRDGDDFGLGPDWTNVKHSTVRSVDRGTLTLAIPGQPKEPIDVHLKRYRPGRFTDRARDGLRGPRGPVEFENLRTAIRRGLACVEPLHAHALPNGHSVLVTRSAPGAPVPDGSWDPATADRIGRLLRHCHDAGLVAHDLHPGNLIDDGSTLRLLDLTSVRFSDDPLDGKQRARGLAFFCRALDGGTDDPTARPLLAAYSPSRDVRTAADRLSRRLRARGLVAFGRRAFRPCRHTSVERAKRRPRVHLYRPAEALHEAARSLVNAPQLATSIKRGRRGEVVKTDELILKTRTAAAARRLFEAAYWLEFAGVARAEPVLLQTFDGRGAVVSQLVRGPTLAKLATQPEIPAEWNKLAESLGRSVGRLHGHGLRNRDLKLDNLVVDPSSGQVKMVDLDGVRRRARAETRGRAHDLGRLLAAWNHADQPGGSAAVGAFLQAYARALGRLRQRSTPARMRTVLRMAEQRAESWASAHRA